MPSVRALTYFLTSLEADKNPNHFMQVIKEFKTKTSLNPWTIRFTLKGNWRKIQGLCNAEYLVEAYHKTLEEVEIEELNEYLECRNFFADIIIAGFPDTGKITQVYGSIINTLGYEPLTRVGFSIGGPIETPYYPISFPLRNGVSAALRYADLLSNTPTENWISTASSYFREVEEEARKVASLLNVEYLGLDVSISPWMDESVLPIINRFTDAPFPGPGSAYAIKKINEFIREAGVSAGIKLLGFNEVMLPVGEDNGLKDLVRRKFLTLKDLLALLPYCLVGIDMVALKFDPRVIKGVFRDAYVASKVKGKVIGVRLIPVVDEVSEVHIDKFGDIPVIDSGL